MKPIYLDYAAATPVDAEVLEAMTPYFSQNFYNPSALYLGGREARAALESARENVARTIGCRSSEVIFTAGGSESTNLAIRGICEQFPESEVLISAIEHEAVRKPAQQYAHVECPVDKHGVVELAGLKALVSDTTVLVSVMYANNEVGSVQPIREIAEYLQQVKQERRADGNQLPLYFHIDACQAPLYLDVNVARLKVDMMTLNGGKIYGPKQSGILYVKSGIRLSPQILGGGQEFGARSGTQNVAFAVGFAKALEKAQASHKENARQVMELSRYFIQELESRFNAQINGHRKKRLPNNVHVTFANADNERVLFSLDEQNMYAATGSACSASSEEASHVLLSMGMSQADARSSLRFTLGLETVRDDIERALGGIETALSA